MQGGLVEFGPGDLLVFLKNKTYRNVGDQFDVRKLTLFFRPLSGDAALEALPKAYDRSGAFYLQERANLRTAPALVDFIEALGQFRLGQYKRVAVSHRRQLQANVDLERLLLALSLHIESDEPDTSDPAVATAVRLIESKLSRPCRIDELAEAASISRASLTKKFKAATGYTIAEYGRNRRLRAVADFLSMDNTIRLRELAAATGFANEFHLSKVFKKQYGVSPRQYRKERP